MTNNDGFVPVTGGVPLDDSCVRDDVSALRDLTVESELDLHIVRLLALHPKLQVRFRNQDLTRLDDETKQALLKDMNDLLGIRTLRSGKK